MAALQHREVDVFVGKGARGNQAAVVLLDAPIGDNVMQALASEIGLPATAFVTNEPREGAYDIRWFAPEREIALCGHGALAAAHVLRAHSGEECAKLRAKDGRQLEVRAIKGGAELELGLTAIPTGPREIPEIEAILGAAPKKVRWNDNGYALAVFDTAETVRALRPDWKAAKGLGTAQIIATALSDGSNEDIVSRVFSSGKEDAATGSAHAVLASYWCDRLGRDRLSAYQASERGGRLECRIDAERVWIGGEVREVEC